MTDRYIEGRPNQFELGDNLVLRMHGGKGKPHTRPGSAIHNEDYYQIPAGAVRLVDLDDLEGQLFQFSARNCYYVNSGWNTLQGPTGNPILSAGTVANFLSKAKWNKHLLVVNDALSQPIKIFNDGSWRCRTLGLPAIDTSGITLTPTAGAVAISHIYSFIRTDEYTIGTVTYREVSAVAEKTIAGNYAVIDPATPLSIAVIPVLANGATGNYNTASSKVEIFRTVSTGSLSYKVGEVTNGTTVFSDTVTDADLVNNEALYTTGGVVDYEQVDPAKYVVISRDTAFYCHVQEDSAVYPNRVRQSIPGALYASPRDFYVDLDSAIIGAGVAGQNPIVFCENGQIYRIEGQIDDLGSGSLEAKEITRSVTLASNRSIVSHKDGGIFFAAHDGFYGCDGFKVLKISEEIPETYAEMIETDDQKSRIYGVYNPTEDRVEWACTWDSSSNDNDSVFAAHLKWGIKPDTPFTTWTGGPENEDNFQPTCLKYFNGDLLRGDRRGYLFTHSAGNLSDPKIDTTTAPENWYKTVIFPDYRSSSLNFGTNEYRKWVPEIVLMADNITNVAILISSNNDNAGFIEDNELYEIPYSSNFTWGDENFSWGTTDFRWNYSSIIDAWRRFPAGSLRCNYKQIRISPSYTLVDSYLNVGTASSDTTTNEITLDDVSKEWFTDPVDYYISFEEDDYASEWLITSRPSDNVIGVSDPDGTLQTVANRNWKINGYKKDQILSLLSLELRYAYIGRTMKQVAGD
jgi:hypothetical protein